jgi:hypothetical protein
MIQAITKCDLCSRKVHGLQCGHSSAHLKCASDRLVQIVELPDGWVKVNSAYVICGYCATALRRDLQVEP